MVRQQISIRLDNNKKERLISIAKSQNKHYSDMVREKVDEILNGIGWEAQLKIKRILKELRDPFVFIKSKRGQKIARKERELREKIAQNIEEAFGLK